MRQNQSIWGPKPIILMAILVNLMTPDAPIFYVCDLDLWPMTLRFKLVQDMMVLNVCTNFRSAGPTVQAAGHKQSDATEKITMPLVLTQEVITIVNTASTLRPKFKVYCCSHVLPQYHCSANLIYCMFTVLWWNNRPIYSFAHAGKSVEYRRRNLRVQDSTSRKYLQLTCKNCFSSF